MADEPTGALDSNTGKQVFDTLKRLSCDKLVIIVSHDRDFSEKYADRIIELADGHVISDVEYDGTASTEAKPGLRGRYGNPSLRVSADRGGPSCDKRIYKKFSVRPRGGDYGFKRKRKEFQKNRRIEDRQAMPMLFSVR